MQMPTGSDEKNGLPKKTPASDMQAEDAGTADSGNEGSPSGQGTEAESAMKQTSKTDAERGERPSKRNSDR